MKYNLYKARERKSRMSFISRLANRVDNIFASPEFGGFMFAALLLITVIFYRPIS